MAGGNEMMAARATMAIYPRIDSYYKHKNSLNFDLMKTKIMTERKSNGAIIWIAHVIIGIFMGFLAFSLNYLEEVL